MNQLENHRALERLTGVIFSLRCKLEIDNRLYSDGLIKQVWLWENTTKEETKQRSESGDLLS